MELLSKINEGLRVQNVKLDVSVVKFFARGKPSEGQLLAEFNKMTCKNSFNLSALLLPDTTIYMFRAMFLLHFRCLL